MRSAEIACDRMRSHVVERRDGASSARVVPDVQCPLPIAVLIVVPLAALRREGSGLGLGLGQGLVAALHQEGVCAPTRRVRIAHGGVYGCSRRAVAAEDGSDARRADLGLGPVGSLEESFALCNFNQLYKMDPETFEVWANSLRRLPRAFLWLTRVSVRAACGQQRGQQPRGTRASIRASILASIGASMRASMRARIRAIAHEPTSRRAQHTGQLACVGPWYMFTRLHACPCPCPLPPLQVRRDTSLFAEANLLYEASAQGIRVPRLAFSFRFPEKDYVAFRALADLMVDNRAYNGHTTGADTLWAGVPAVLTEGRHLAGRAGMAFASALGSTSMVAPTMRAYEDSVFDLGTQTLRLITLRRRLLHMREHAPFFDLPQLAQGQHRLAAAMWGVYAAGHLPMHVIAAR